MKSPQAVENLAAFTAALVQANGHHPPSATFTELFSIAWDIQHAMTPSDQLAARQRWNLLLRSGDVINSWEAAYILDRNQRLIRNRWTKNGTLRAVRIGQNLYVPRQDVMNLRRHLRQGLSLQEAADRAATSRHILRRAIRSGRLPHYRTLRGHYRILPANLQEYLVAEKTSLSVRETARRLDVTPSTIREWIHKGAVTFRESGQLILDEAEITGLEQSFAMIRPLAFELLFETKTKVRDTLPALKPEQAAQFLGIKYVTVRNWTNLDLLPHYLRTPEAFPRPRREYPQGYLEGLMRYMHAQGRTKASVKYARIYKRLCLEKGRII